MRNYAFLIFLFFSYSYGVPLKVYEGYAYLFGNEDVNPEYREIVRQAWDDYECTKPMVPIKNMNSFASKLIGVDLYSFTLFGIWLNDALFAKCDDSLKKWLLYHETAHAVLNHHAKALTIVSLMLPVIYSSYKTVQLRWHTSSGLLVAGLLSYGLFEEILKPYITDQEKEADLAAVRVLCKTGQKIVVEDYLSYLQKEISFGKNEDDWHFSTPEQYEYIKTIFEIYH